MKKLPELIRRDDRSSETEVIFCMRFSAPPPALPARR
jgi:hypothetical protein